MCKSKAEGGQRCSFHTSQAVRRAERAYDTSPSGGTRALLVDAWVEHASTPSGHREAFANAMNGAFGPGGLPSSYWTQIAQRGADLRSRNQMLAQAFRSDTTAVATEQWPVRTVRCRECTDGASVHGDDSEQTAHNYAAHLTRGHGHSAASAQYNANQVVNTASTRIATRKATACAVLRLTGQNMPDEDSRALMRDLTETGFTLTPSAAARPMTPDAAERFRSALARHVPAHTVDLGALADEMVERQLDVDEVVQQPRNSALAAAINA